MEKKDLRKEPFKIRAAIRDKVLFDLVDKGVPIAILAKVYGVPRSSIYNWKQNKTSSEIGRPSGGKKSYQIINALTGSVKFLNASKEKRMFIIKDKTKTLSRPTRLKICKKLSQYL